jgi:hypothetical protein
MNLPKLVDDDESLYVALLGDAFTRVELHKSKQDIKGAII